MSRASSVGMAIASNGAYIGVAPNVNLINVKVSADDGRPPRRMWSPACNGSTDNKARYNIRVVNLSLNSSVAQSFDVDPIDAACRDPLVQRHRRRRFGGQQRGRALTAPANDPFVITVGATDDHGTPSIGRRHDGPLLGYGATSAAKPDLVAPGTNIVSLWPIRRHC